MTPFPEVFPFYRYNLPKDSYLFCLVEDWSKKEKKKYTTVNVKITGVNSCVINVFDSEGEFKESAFQVGRIEAYVDYRQIVGFIEERVEYLAKKLFKHKKLEEERMGVNSLIEDIRIEHGL